MTPTKAPKTKATNSRKPARSFSITLPSLIRPYTGAQAREREPAGLQDSSEEILLGAGVQPCDLPRHTAPLASPGVQPHAGRHVSTKTTDHMATRTSQILGWSSGCAVLSRMVIITLSAPSKGPLRGPCLQPRAAQHARRSAPPSARCPCGCSSHNPRSTSHQPLHALKTARELAAPRAHDRGNLGRPRPLARAPGDPSPRSSECSTSLVTGAASSPQVSVPPLQALAPELAYLTIQSDRP
jgi:hypothetical protein